MPTEFACFFELIDEFPLFALQELVDYVRHQAPLPQSLAMGFPNRPVQGSKVVNSQILGSHIQDGGIA